MKSGLIKQLKFMLPAVVVNSASLRLAGRAKAPVSTCAVVALGLLFVAGCNEGKPDPKAEAPPAANVQPDMDANNFKVDRPELFPLATAVAYKAAPALDVTGVVQPDISRAVPVISLAAGRVVEVKARLGDVVKKGQLLLRVQSNDVSGAYQGYRKAVNDELLARLQLHRQTVLYDKGAVAKSALEQAEDMAKNTQADLDAATEQLKILGVDKDHPSGIVDIRAPISGVITDQQITNASGVQGLGSPNPFIISDLSYVWIICDVYENDLDAVHVGEFADIRLSAYPNKVFKGRIDNILPVLDPTIRTTKVRIEVANPGIDARGNVCDRDFLWQAGGDVCGSAVVCNFAPARSRVGLRAAGRGTLQTRWKWSRERCFPTICKKLFRGSSREIKWFRMRWCCKTRWSNR